MKKVEIPRCCQVTFKYYVLDGAHGKLAEVGLSLQ